MRKIIFSAILGVAFVWVNAQSYVPTRDDISSFFNTKTLVVLLDNPLLEYNIVIKEVMQQEWKITKFDFISFTFRREFSFELNVTISTPKYLPFLYKNDTTLSFSV